VTRRRRRTRLATRATVLAIAAQRIQSPTKAQTLKRRAFLRIVAAAAPRGRPHFSDTIGWALVSLRDWLVSPYPFPLPDTCKLVAEAATLLNPQQPAAA